MKFALSKKTRVTLWINQPSNKLQPLVKDFAVSAPAINISSYSNSFLASLAYEFGLIKENRIIMDQVFMTKGAANC